MALISTEDAKAYLRVDSSDEDATVGILLASAIRLCIDIARLTDDQWEVIDSDAASSDEYTEAELSAIRETMKVAILYTCAYLFEHREEADHHALTMTLRSLLFAIREGAFSWIVSIVLCKPRNRFLVQCIPSTSGCCVSQPGLTVKGAEHRFAA